MMSRKTIIVGMTASPETRQEDFSGETIMMISDLRLSRPSQIGDEFFHCSFLSMAGSLLAVANHHKSFDKPKMIESCYEMASSLTAFRALTREVMAELDPRAGDWTEARFMEPSYQVLLAPNYNVITEMSRERLMEMSIGEFMIVGRGTARLYPIVLSAFEESKANLTHLMSPETSSIIDEKLSQKQRSEIQKYIEERDPHRFSIDDLVAAERHEIVPIALVQGRTKVWGKISSDSVDQLHLIYYIGEVAYCMENKQLIEEAVSKVVSGIVSDRMASVRVVEGESETEVVRVREMREEEEEQDSGSENEGALLRQVSDSSKKADMEDMSSGWSEIESSDSEEVW